MEKVFAKTLLVEDEPAHAVLVQRALRDCVQEVCTVGTVAAALRALKEINFDLIITDLNLPDSQGLNHVRDFSAVDPNRPMIVLTSSSSVQDAVAAMRLGAKDFIVKDFGANFKEMLALALARLFSSLQLEQATQRLQREKELLQAAILDSDDALALIDCQGLLRFSNPAFERFVKLCGGKTTSVFELASPDCREANELLRNLRQRLNDLTPGAVWKTEVCLPGEIPHFFTLSLSVVPENVATEQAKDRRFVWWVREITEQKKREKFQREILSTTTHDLKGPLGAISLSADLVDGLLVDGEKAKQLNLRIKAAAQGALSLIDEFLSARRISEGTFVLRPAVQDWRSLILEVIANYSAIAAARKLELVVAVKESVQIPVDRLGFERVLSNLLSNACKFTPANGKILVTAETNNAGALLIVSDSGSGMSAADVQRIFQRYGRLEKHHDIQGDGLGLFLVKNIVSAHGGKIDVRSTPGKGTAFEIFFPKVVPVNAQGEIIVLDFD